MHRSRFLSLFILLLTGCPSAFTRTDSDGGLSPDASAAPEETATPDAAPLGPCASGIEWLDTEPALVASLASGSAPAITADDQGFVVAHVRVDRDDGAYWVDVQRLPIEGPSAGGSATSLYAAELSAVPRTFASTDPSGRAYVAASVDAELRWSRGPSFDERHSIAIDRLLGAVAFEDDAVLLETHDAYLDRERPPERGVAGRVTRHPFDGSAPALVEDLDPAFGFDFWSPSLVTTAEGPWLGLFTDFDFPPTVVLQRPRSGAWDGGGCGTGAYEFLADSGEAAVMSQDCGAEVRIERRRPDGAERERATIAGRDADSVFATRIATDGDRFAIVYRGDDGMAHVAVLDRELTPIAQDVVPGSDDLDLIPAGPLGIAATADGTFAALTTVFRIGEGVPDGDLSLRRFRVCR